MTSMIRKQVYIEPEQERTLKRLSRATGRTEAEIIRAALDLHLQGSRVSPRDPEAWRSVRRFVEDLIEQGPVRGGRKWTRDEIHDR